MTKQELKQLEEQLYAIVAIQTTLELILSQEVTEKATGALILSNNQLLSVQNAIDRMTFKVTE